MVCESGVKVMSRFCPEPVEGENFFTWDEEGRKRNRFGKEHQESVVCS